MELRILRQEEFAEWEFSEHDPQFRPSKLPIAGVDRLKCLEIQASGPSNENL